MGRTALSASGFGTSGNTIAVSGLSNPYTITWGTASSNYAINATSLTPGCPAGGGTVSGTQNVITAISLPNGQQYTFAYDPTYGTLDRVTLPDGGFVSYVWGINPLSEQETEIYYPNGVTQGTTINCLYDVDAPAVMSRYESFDGSTFAQEQDFSYTTDWTTGIRTTTDTITDDVAGTKTAVDYVYSSYEVPSPPYDFGDSGTLPLEQSISYLSSPGGSLVREVLESWTDPYSRVLRQVQVGSGGSASSAAQAWCYNTEGLVVEHDEFAFGQSAATLPSCVPSGTSATAGADTRETLTAYATFGAGTGIYDRPASVETVNPANQAIAAETDYSYDSNGNSLTVTRDNGSAPSVSQYVYDADGNVIKYTDPDGNATTYALQCDDAYPQQISRPTTVTGSTTVTHTTTFTYDCSSGRMLSRTNVENAATTSYTYGDPLGRVTQVNFPDGGETTYAYTPNTVEVKRLFSGSYWTDAISHLDGFGRADRQFVFDGSTSSADTTDTIYDGEGLPYFVTYPYESTGVDSSKATGNSSATPGDTFSRDVLGRTVEVTHTDGSTVTTVYGNTATAATTTQTDENGNISVLASDGLGRLLSAYHVAGGAPYDQANYSYDLLNGLLSVGQGAQTRSFNYDELGRLLTASNPESGSTSYQYDADGNVLTQTDANGTVVTSQYDALDRERVRGFQPGSGVAATSSIEFDYDIDPTGSPTTDAYGHLTRVSDGAIVDTYGSYDPVGRPLTADVIVNGADYHTHVTYDGVGFPTYELLPDGRYLYLEDDYEGRTDTISDGGYGTHYLNYRNYEPDSALGDQQLGDGLDQGWWYDSRGRVTDDHLYVNGDYGDQSTWRMELAFGYNADSDVSWVKDELGGPAQNYSFTYDSLHRLTGWSTQAGLSCAFNLDEYGNLGITSGSSACGMPLALTFNTSNNQIVGDVYSAAGQRLSDTAGTSYTWDANGHLVGYAAPGEQASYLYDGLGRRIESTVDGVSTIYAFDPLGHRVADLSGGNWTDYVVTPEGERLAVIAGSGASAPVHFLNSGPLGTVRVITDSSGNNTLSCAQNSSYPDASTLTYAPFGAGLDCTQSGEVFGFAGKPLDAESGLQ
ncbi:MAG: hypothetical protein ACRD1Y_05400, partial [Terriglobales bacterium]